MISLFGDINCNWSSDTDKVKSKDFNELSKIGPDKIKVEDENI